MRYIFPVLPLLIAAFLLSGDRRLIKTYVIYTCALLLNVLAAFVVVKSAALRGAEYNVITLIGSVINLMAFASMITAYWSMTVRREIYPAYCEERMEKTNSQYEILKKKGSLRISEIAYAVGFNDPKYFSICFKKEFGMLPRKLEEDDKDAS